MRAIQALVALLLLTVPTAAAEQQTSRAWTIADNAGAVVGGARFCGVNPVRVERIGENVDAAIRRTATTKADQRSALDLFPTAVTMGDRQQRENTSGHSCSAVLRSFDSIETMLRSER